MKELTIEITNYCPENCPYCSSDTVDEMSKAYWLDACEIINVLATGEYDRIIISGGEPLAHPQFYTILNMCYDWAPDVVVYTNALKHIAYNANVIDGIYLEASITLTPETQKLRVLRRVEHGREKVRPEVSFSRNHDGNCGKCNHVVLRPDGTLDKSPCQKHRLTSSTQPDHHECPECANEHENELETGLTRGPE